MRKANPVIVGLSSIIIVLMTMVVAIVGLESAKATVADPYADSVTISPATAIVRLGPNWYEHENARHTSINIKSVTINSAGNLQIRRSDVSGSTNWKIAMCMATSDETLAKLNIIAGCSGGGAMSEIRFYRNGKHVRADSPIFGKYANVWFESKITK